MQTSTLKVKRQELLDRIALSKKHLAATDKYIDYSAHGLISMVSSVSGSPDPNEMAAFYLREGTSALLSPRWVSQLGQEKLVASLLDFKKNGYFIEIGCGNGTIISNSYTLEAFFDWTGLLVEPSTEFCHDMRRTRRSQIVEMAVTANEDEGEMTLISGNVYGSCLQKDLDDAHAGFLGACEQLGLRNVVATIHAKKLCTDYNVPSIFDYLSLDIEGGELDILKAWPFEGHRPLLLSVEHNYGPNRQEVRALMNGHGYSCFELQWDDFFICDQLLEFEGFPDSTEEMGQPDSVSAACFKARLLAASWVLNEQCHREIESLRGNANNAINKANSELERIEKDLQDLAKLYEQAFTAKTEDNASTPDHETSATTSIYSRALKKLARFLSK